MADNPDLASQAPRYQQIAAALRRRIQAGEWAIGDRLPPESELKTEFGVSVLTIREAIRVLRAEQLVDVQRGRGTFVRAPNTAVTVRLDAAQLAAIDRRAADAGLTGTDARAEAIRLMLSYAAAKMPTSWQP